jgi:hypothetical protein
MRLNLRGRVVGQAVSPLRKGWMRPTKTQQDDNWRPGFEVGPLLNVEAVDWQRLSVLVSPDPPWELLCVEELGARGVG